MFDFVESAERTTSFLFAHCQLRQTGDGLLVIVPAAEARWRGGIATGSRILWTPPVPLPPGVHSVRGQPGDPFRLDRDAYPRQVDYAGPVSAVRFRGASFFGRVPGSTGWILQVCAAVASADLDDWERFDAIEIIAGAQRVAVAGPTIPLDPEEAIAPFDPPGRLRRAKVTR